MKSKIKLIRAITAMITALISFAILVMDLLDKIG